ncbi:MAG TPA: ABC transporter ATP-binding protein [Thermoplasmata archaeon]|nr:ABC transporter ATP-binding protein [Thermoplasmata archaeon]
MKSIVTIEGLRKAFRNVVAIDDLSLDVPESSTYLFLGPNGSGKTTLIRILAGVLRATKGTVRVMGTDPYRHPERLVRDVGIAYETHALPPWSSARTFLEFAASAKGLNGDSVDSIGERFGLVDYWTREMGTYSAGMRKRVMLAQAWLGDPPLMILDEPFSNLDPEGRRLLVDLLADRASKDLTTLVATHLAEPGTTPTHIACMFNGRLEAVGSIDELGERYQARTVVLAVLDSAFAVRVLLGQGIRSVSIVEHGIALRGNGTTVKAAVDALRDEGVDVRVAGESHDIWSIYRAVLLGRDKVQIAGRSSESMAGAG